MHTCSLCFGQCRAKLRLCADIWPHLGDAFHLNHKGHSALISLPLCLCQFVQVLHTPLGRCIREIADTVHFQCAAFDFQQVLLFALFHVKVDAGLPIGEFRLDIVVALFCKPLSYHLIGCLTVHIDPAEALLVYRHKVVFCFAFRVVRHFQPHRSTGQQQFPAPPGVLDMDGFHRSIHFHIGNKAVGTVNKNAVCDFSVFQSLLHFQYRIRELCPSCLPRYSSTTILPLSLLQSSSLQ